MQFGLAHSICVDYKRSYKICNSSKKTRKVEEPSLEVASLGTDTSEEEGGGNNLMINKIVINVHFFILLLG